MVTDGNKRCRTWTDGYHNITPWQSVSCWLWTASCRNLQS